MLQSGQDPVITIGIAKYNQNEDAHKKKDKWFGVTPNVVSVRAQKCARFA